jgi:pyridoxal phosphate enzyme (YggS family)
MGMVGENIAVIRDRMDAAAQRAGRDPSDITLLVVTKKQSVSAVTEAIEAGAVDVGENYVREASEKRTSLSSRLVASVRWHLIGHLQTNKAKAAVQTFDLIQSADSDRLVHRLWQEAQRSAKIQKILLQVHLGQEETKSGLRPEQVLEMAAEVSETPGIELQGLMGIAPAGEDPRRYFSELRHLYDDLTVSARRILSMGMSGDFETAIEEGATMVRIGTAIFGPRLK